MCCEHMDLSGTIIAVTKVKTAEGMKVSVTLEGGVYLEVSNIHNKELFKELSVFAELEKNLKLTVEQG